MAYEILSKLKTTDSLKSCSITVSDIDFPRGRKTIFGRDIKRITRSSIEFIGGETGQERLSVPVDSVEQIELGGKIIYRKKRRIERIYPRG